MKPGKKVGTLAVRLKAEAQRRNFAHVDIELRLDGRGSFHAHYEGAWYSASTQADLEEQLRVAIEKTADVEWTRYLIVHYKAEAWPTDGDSGRPLTSGPYESFGIEDDRAELAPDPHADVGNTATARALSPRSICTGRSLNSPRHTRHRRIRPRWSGCRATSRCAPSSAMTSSVTGAGV